MKKILNKRLERLSAFINENDSVIDIGCDHALLGIYLMLNRKNIKVVGSDINYKPLEKAKENISKYHLEDKIELRLGFGLDTVTDDIDTVVISGMGGITIVNILKDIKKYPNIRRIIISPNSDFSLTRCEISKLGFMINEEEIVEEKGKYYLISEYIKGYDTTDYFFGKLNKFDKEVINYYQNIMDKNKKIISKVSFIKKMKLLKENRKIKKWLK